MRLFLCGDVMTGRGIDQALPHPANPVLHEPYVRDAREYVHLAEKAHAPIPRPLSFDYIWGDALKELERAEVAEPASGGQPLQSNEYDRSGEATRRGWTTQPPAAAGGCPAGAKRVDFRIVNLETAVTSAETPWPDKGIHYRMHPQNIGCLSAAHISACALANNHVLDWGYDGLSETLQTLNAAGIAYSGAGNDADEAMRPAILNATGKRRLLLFSFGSITSGIPPEWKATSPAAAGGVNLLDDLSEATAARVCDEMRAHQQPGDLILASIHWGSNWGYDISSEQIAFAHRLIEEGVAIVHGHSSHHVKAIEVFKGRLILYGCGDFLTDYEGISGYETFRGDLALMYLIDLDSDNGELIAARLVPMQMRRFRLERASAADARWLCDLLNKLGAKFNTRVKLQNDNSLVLEWPRCRQSCLQFSGAAAFV
jgi:poly-gamma-glutamate synthesis protein (capsule biosynthesis protein)